MLNFSHSQLHAASACHVRQKIPVTKPTTILPVVGVPPVQPPRF